MVKQTDKELEGRVQELGKIVDKLSHFEQELSHANNRVMAILDSLDAIVYVADMKTYEILFINQYTRNIFGNIVGKICWQTLQENKTGPCDFCSNDKLVDSAGNPAGMYLWERQKKNQRWYEMRDRAIIWENGQVVRLEIATDMTDRRKAEQELLHANNRVMAILDSLDAIVYVADMKTYEILFINQYTRNIFGNIVGKICWQTLQENKTGPCDFCSNDKLVDSAGNPAGMYLWERQKKNQRWYELRDRAIIWEDGRVVRLEIATDITDRKKAEQEKEKLIEELQNALNEIKVLRGILPICSGCKRVRDDKGNWKPMESYIQSHTDAEFSHYICPDCKKLFHLK